MEYKGILVSADAFYERHLRHSVTQYLEGQNDWKWVVDSVRRSGFSKRQALSILGPLKGYGSTFRRHALFQWLEES